MAKNQKSRICFAYSRAVVVRVRVIACIREWDIKLIVQVRISQKKIKVSYLNSRAVLCSASKMCLVRSVWENFFAWVLSAAFYSFSLLFFVFFFYSFAVWYNLLLAVMWRRVGLCRWTDRSFSRIRFRAHAQHTHRERNERVRQLRKVIAWTGYKTETTNEMRSSPTQWEKHMKPSAYVFSTFIFLCSRCIV